MNQRKFRIFAIILISILFNSKSIIANASNDVRQPKKIEWTFEGYKGKFDRQSIQRGFKVFKEVCSACHSANALAFRNLTAIGYSPVIAKTIASGYTINAGPNDEGQMYTRPGNLSDHMPGPYANEKEARSVNNGAYPPDLSLIIKARDNGANYVYSLLTGFQEPVPTDFVVGENMHYNPYFAGGGQQLAMAPPLVSDNQVEFDDGTAATINQMSYDVVNFLQWLAEPEMEERKSMGWSVMIFVLVFTIIFYFAKKRIWSRLENQQRNKN